MLPCHVFTFLAYMVIMGLAGVVDHSGIKLNVEVGGYTVYSSVDHDRHHQYTNVNYAFPFPFMDVLFGTYHTTGS